MYGFGNGLGESQKIHLQTLAEQIIQSNPNLTVKQVTLSLQRMVPSASSAAVKNAANVAVTSLVQTAVPFAPSFSSDGSQVLSGPLQTDATGTVASVPILDTSTGNVLPPSAGQTTPVPAAPSVGSGPTGILTPAPSTGAPAAATPFSLCFPGDTSGPISDSIPVCTYTAIGAAIILAFFFMKK